MDENIKDPLSLSTDDHSQSHSDCKPAESEKDFKDSFHGVSLSEVEVTPSSSNIPPQEKTPASEPPLSGTSTEEALGAASSTAASAETSQDTSQSDLEDAFYDLAIQDESIQIGDLEGAGDLSVDKFLQSRCSSMQRLFDEFSKVKPFMDEVSFKLVFEECHKPDKRLRTKITPEWAQMIQLWETTRENIRRVMDKTKLLVRRCKARGLTLHSEFQNYFDSLVVVFEDLDEIRHSCSDGMKKYRQFCSYFDDYLYLTHISTMPVFIAPLYERLSAELEKFAAFHAKMRALKKELEETAA